MPRWTERAEYTHKHTEENEARLCQHSDLLLGKFLRGGTRKHKAHNSASPQADERELGIKVCVFAGKVERNRRGEKRKEEEEGKIE